MATLFPTYRQVDEQIGIRVQVFRDVDYMRDVVMYKAKCSVCGVSTGWVEVTATAMRECIIEPVAFITSVLKSRLIRENCAESDWGAHEQTEAQQLACVEFERPVHRYSSTVEDYLRDPLIDGLTIRECMLRWESNRVTVEGGRALADMELLTDAQIAAGKAAHQAMWGPARRAVLQSLVREAAEEERRQVRIDIQEVDNGD
jgi:hypothetical protein